LIYLIDAYPTGPVACVSDSYDIYHACEFIWGKDLHDKVMKRDGTLVIRSDSGICLIKLDFTTIILFFRRSN
jgi:nicotinamide phosphoribosyltransferase